MREKSRFRRMRELLDDSVLVGIPAGSTVEVAAADADLQSHDKVKEAQSRLAMFRIGLHVLSHVPIGQITVRPPAY